MEISLSLSPGSGLYVPATSPIGATSVALDADGLIFRDLYPRDDAAIGNNWTEFANAGTISAIDIDGTQGYVKKTAFANTGGWQRNNETIPESGIAWALVYLEGETAGNQFSIRIGNSAAGSHIYDFKLDLAGVTDWILAEYAAAIGNSDTQGDASAGVNGRFWMLRMVWEKSGSDRIIRAYAVEDKTSLALARGDLAIVAGPITDTTALDFSTYGYYSQTAFRESRVYENGICPRNVTVSGVSVGQKVKIDNGDASVGDGNDIVLDVDTLAFPMTTLYLLDADDNEIDSVSPSGGFYGGSTFTAS